MRERIAILGVLALVAAPLALVIGLAGPAAAANPILVVDDVNDGAPVAADCTTPVPGSCSVRDAFAAAAAAGDDVVVLQANTTYNITYCAVGNIVYSGADLLTVNGNGATIKNTCAAAADSRVIQATGVTSKLTLNNVTITGGNPTTGGGGIGIGGASSVLEIDNSTVSGNTAPFAAGTNGASVLLVQNSTMTGNVATASTGGAIETFGNATIINSTITGNSAPLGGGGIFANAGNVALVYATVDGNSSTSGGDNVKAVGTLTSFGSVVGPPGDGVGPNCVVAGTTSQGYNFERSGNTCGFGAGAGDVVNGSDPLLGALANNGGPTQTQLPATGSPLIDKIPASSPCAGVNITVDQRGLPRPTTAGQFCDIGAVEVQPVVALIRVARFTG